MPRYIERKAVERALLTKGFYPSIIKRAIETVPDADVQEVKRAYWIPSPDGIRPIRCSACHQPALWKHEVDAIFGDYGEWRSASRYCPNCGAKMDGGEGE